MLQVPGFNASDVSPSLLDTKPSRTNMLMAAAEMHEDAKRSMPTGPERPRLSMKRKTNRPLKVVK